MQPNRKGNRQYFFTVEGETEKWYLDWLQEAINADSAAKYTVSIRSKVEKNPLKFAKGISIIAKPRLRTGLTTKAMSLCMKENSMKP